MNEILNFLSRLSFGEFIIIWTSTITLLLLILIFGLVILSKIRRIKVDLINVTRNFDALNQRLQEDIERVKSENLNLNKGNDNSKYWFQKHRENNSKNNFSDRLFPSLENHDQFKNQTENSSELDFLKEELLESLEKKPDIRRKIMHLLKTNSKPISYSDLAKYLSQGPSESDFELILKELEQLKTEGKIISQVSAGKLFFQKNRLII